MQLLFVFNDALEKYLSVVSFKCYAEP